MATKEQILEKMGKSFQEIGKLLISYSQATPSEELVPVKTEKGTKRKLAWTNAELDTFEELFDKGVRDVSEFKSVLSKPKDEITKKITTYETARMKLDSEEESDTHEEESKKKKKKPAESEEEEEEEKKPKKQKKAASKEKEKEKKKQGEKEKEKPKESKGKSKEKKTKESKEKSKSGSSSSKSKKDKKKDQRVT